MAAERSAIAEARENLAQQRLQQEAQRIADQEFAEIFKECARFLEARPETRNVNWVGRIVVGLPTRVMAPVIPFFSKFRNVPISDIGDSRSFLTSLNGTGEPVTTMLRSSTAAPSITGEPIDLFIESLPEILRISPKGGELHNAEFILNDHGISLIRTANLEDVARFQPVIRELTQPHA